jgi:type I restriction enzyme S subunit
MELPNGWVFAKLCELISSEGVFCDGDWVESKDQDPNGDIRLIQLADIGDGRFVDKSNRFLTKSKSELLKCTYLKNGDILVARMPAPLGRATIFPLDEKERYVTVVDVAIIRIGNDFVSNKYCCYMINSLPIRNTIAGMQSGTTRKRVARTKLETVSIPLPPLAEQHRIVAKIDALFSKLDKGVETMQTIRQQLQTYRQAVLKWAFEGIEFEKKQMKSISNAFGGAAFKSGDFQSEGKYQVIKIGNVRPGVVRLWEKPAFLDSIDGYERYRLQKGDVIITLTGTRKKRDYGFTAVVAHDNMLLNQRVAAIRFSKDYLPKFFMYYSWTRSFQDDFFASETGNVGQGNVGMKAIIETYVPYCSLEEQTVIVNEIESRLSVCDKLESIVDESLVKAEALRQSILKKAFAGQLVPQDPNDESADKLLERIKKTTAPKRK